MAVTKRTFPDQLFLPQQFKELVHLHGQPDVAALVRQQMRANYGKDYDLMLERTESLAKMYPKDIAPHVPGYTAALNVCIRANYQRDGRKYEIQLTHSQPQHSSYLTPGERWLVRTEHLAAKFAPENPSSAMPEQMRDWCDTILLELELAMEWALYVSKLAWTVRGKFFACHVSPVDWDHCIPYVLAMIHPEWGTRNIGVRAISLPQKIDPGWWRRHSQPVTNERIRQFLDELRLVELAKELPTMEISCFMTGEW